MCKIKKFQGIVVTVAIIIIVLIGYTPAFAATQDINTICKNLINKMPDYKSSEYGRIQSSGWDYQRNMWRRVFKDAFLLFFWSEETFENRKRRTD